MDFISFFQSIILGGTATTVMTEILKSPYIPANFQKYPRLTTGVVSLIAATIAVYNSGITLSSFHDVLSWVEVILGTGAVAVFTYKNYVK